MNGRRPRRWLAAALCLLFLAGALLTVMLMCLHTQRHQYTCGLNCAIRVQIAEALSLTRQAGLAAVLVAFAALVLCYIRASYIALAGGRPGTPVTLKTRMND